MEPNRQIEIQLGHMCNNRCVFCVSGQRTALRQAGPMPTEPILARIREARTDGHHKITLLGGEPTLQPGFMEIVEETVALGFEEIVLFTNGAKTARAELIDALLALSPDRRVFTWRISIQGANRLSHERTTLKKGSFGRIIGTLENLRERDERITVNMCVVSSNYEDVAEFPSLLEPYGVSQLHLDMVRPSDSGDRSEDELRAMIPRYSALAGPFRSMIDGFDEVFDGSFDVNIGNLPYCIAPDLAPWIHHDGQPTQTIAIDGDDRLSRPWNKYLVKRRDKLKAPRCADCVMSSRCSGVFERYARFYGLDELQPIGPEQLQAADPKGRMVGIWAAGLLDGVETHAEDEARVVRPNLAIALRPESAIRGAKGRYEGFTVHYLRGRPTPADVHALDEQLTQLGRAIAPIGDDLATPPAPALARALATLRAAAPYGSLGWIESRSFGDRLELRLRDGSFEVELWLALDPKKSSGGYRVTDGEPNEANRRDLSRLLSVLRTPQRVTTSAP